MFQYAGEIPLYSSLEFLKSSQVTEIKQTPTITMFENGQRITINANEYASKEKERAFNELKKIKELK